MLNCREMSELSSDIMENHLSLSNRWAVYRHFRICTRCKLYVEQLKLTTEVLQKLPLNEQSVDSSAIIKKLNLPEN